MFIYLRETETEQEQGRGTERGRQNPKQAPGSELSAQSLTRGLNSQTVRSWPEPKSDAQPTEPPRRPNRFCLKPDHSLFCVFWARGYWREVAIERRRKHIFSDFLHYFQQDSTGSTTKALSDSCLNFMSLRAVICVGMKCGCHLQLESWALLGAVFQR